MSAKPTHLFRAVILFILLVSFVPAHSADALVSTAAPPPVDMFQLPWDQGIAWVAIDGLDNGTKRPTSSSHNYKLGGAIDFAPHNNMVTGENTSNFWVAAAADGTVIATSSCYVTLAHANGWITQYQFLGNIKVKLGDVVARNQRLGIIADGVRLKYCPGFQDINVPHLHFMLRPSIIGASFAGWEVKYNSFFNSTTFTKNGTTVGLFKPLMNTFDTAATPTPTLVSTATGTPNTSTPSITPTSSTATPTTPTPSTPTPDTPTFQPSPTPTLSGPYVSTAIAPQSLAIGESGLVTVSLNNVPTEGYTSAEFTCSYSPNLFEISNITIASLFGADPVSAINGPQAQSLIVAIAGSDSHKATTSGATFTFNVKGLQAGQTVIDCRARVSQGNNVLTEIPFVTDSLTILNGTATPSSTPSLMPTVTQSPASATPTTASSATPGGPSETPFPTFTPTPSGPSSTPMPSSTPGGPSPTPFYGMAFDFVAAACSATWTSGAGQLPCPGVDGDPKGFVLKVNSSHIETGATDPRPGLITVPQNVQDGFIQGMYPTFHVQTGDRFRSTINCEFGATSCYVAFRLDYQVGADPIKTFWGPFLERYDGAFYSVDVDLTPLAGKDVKFILTVLAAGSPTGDRALWVGPIIYRATASPTPGPTATAPANWLTFTNSRFGFQFLYPNDSQLSNQTDTYARIDLPFAQQGTNLREKYLEVVVSENIDPCQSPMTALRTSENVIINGTPFLKQVGDEGAAGNQYRLFAYSTSRDNVCVSLDFILHSLGIGAFPTPQPLEYDVALESAVFEQIVSFYTWFTPPTSTPGSAPTATGSPVPTSTSTPVTSFTSTPSSSPTPSGNNGAVAGQITVSKPVTINVYDASMNLVGTVETTPDGGFRLDVPPGTYTVVAAAPGFLSAQGTVTLTTGNTTILPPLTLVAGDIDGNNVIDQFDALTIGMSYNSATPAAADLNNDGVINVLDLEALAKNYRRTGPVSWQ